MALEKKKKIQQFYRGYRGCCVFQTVSNMDIVHCHKNQHIHPILELSKVLSVFAFPWEKETGATREYLPTHPHVCPQTAAEAPELLVPRRPSLRLLISLSSLFIHRVPFQNGQPTFFL